MKTIFQHIEQVRQQPHHIRKQVVVATAAVGTALIALVWLVGSVTTGAFSIRETAVSAPSTVAAAADIFGNQNLAGAGAAAALSQVDATPAHIEIIDSSPVASGKKAEQTTIPF
jgi:hypothetical protein